MGEAVNRSLGTRHGSLSHHVVSTPQRRRLGGHLLCSGQARRRVPLVHKQAYERARHRQTLPQHDALQQPTLHGLPELRDAAQALLQARSPQS